MSQEYGLGSLPSFAEIQLPDAHFCKSVVMDGRRHRKRLGGGSLEAARGNHMDKTSMLDKAFSVNISGRGWTPCDL